MPVENRAKWNLNIIMLLIALVVSNAGWAMWHYSMYLSCAYQEGFLKARTAMLEQVMAVLPVVTNRQAMRVEVVTAAKLGGREQVNWASPRTTQVGGLTLEFDEDDRFVGLANK